MLNALQNRHASPKLTFSPFGYCLICCLLNIKFASRQCLIAGLAFFAMTTAHAEIYKHVDEQGRVTYSNVPMKGATKLNLEPLNTVPATRPKTSVASPSSFPKVDGDTQKKRDDTRRKILEEELAAEEKLLDGSHAQAKTQRRNRAPRKKCRRAEKRTCQPEVTPSPFLGLEHLSTAVILLDGHFRIAYANPVAENLFEISLSHINGLGLPQIFGIQPPR